MVSFTTIPEARASYEHWLARQPLSTHTRRTYLTQVNRYCTYLSTFSWEYGHPLQEPHARDYAVRDYKTTLKVVHLAKPSSVNLALAAVDHFYRFLELPTTQVAREKLPAQAPRALEPPEQKRFLRAVERCASARDRAIVLLLFYTGLRISDVTPQTVEAYIALFSTEPKAGACPVDPQKAGQINLCTRKSAPSVHRQPRTINHQLSVLASFFAYCIQRDTERGVGGWMHRANPVPASPSANTNAHGMPGRDAPRRGKPAELRRRVPRRIPRQVDPPLAQQLIDMANSWRDKAILTLLYRTGQRIGDWSSFAGRHGILGMTLADIDEQAGTITVLLKGARDEHRVPVTDDFWPFYHQYLSRERQAGPRVSALWMGLRKEKGTPLTYASFESSLRYIGRKLGANVNAHMFRHTLAQALVDQGRLKVAQDLLGHRHLETTADVYASTDHRALVEALGAAKSQFDTEVAQRSHSLSTGRPALSPQHYVFAYDDVTLQELDQAAERRPSTP